MLGLLREHSHSELAGLRGLWSRLYSALSPAPPKRQRHRVRPLSPAGSWEAGRGCWLRAPGLLWGPLSPRCEPSPERSRLPPSTHWLLERPSHSHGRLPFAPPRSLCPPALHGGRWGPQASSPGLGVQTVLSGTAASPGCLRRARGPGRGTRPRHAALLSTLWLRLPTPPRAPQVAGVPWSGPPSSLHLPLHSARGPPPVRP